MVDEEITDMERGSSDSHIVDAVLKPSLCSVPTRGIGGDDAVK